MILDYTNGSFTINGDRYATGSIAQISHSDDLEYITIKMAYPGRVYKGHYSDFVYEGQPFIGMDDLDKWLAEHCYAKCCEKNNDELFEMLIAINASMEQMINNMVRTDGDMTPMQVKVTEMPQKTYWDMYGWDENEAEWRVLFIPGSNDPMLYMDRYGVVYDHAPRGLDITGSTTPTRWTADVSLDVQNKSTKFITGTASTIALAVRNNGQEDINGEDFDISFIKFGLSDTTITPNTSIPTVGVGALNNSYLLSLYVDNEYTKVYKCSSNLSLGPGETGYFVFNVVHAGAMDNFQLQAFVVPAGEDDDATNNGVIINFSK